MTTQNEKPALKQEGSEVVADCDELTMPLPEKIMIGPDSMAYVIPDFGPEVEKELLAVGGTRYVRADIVERLRADKLKPIPGLLASIAEIDRYLDDGDAKNSVSHHDLNSVLQAARLYLELTEG